MCIRDRPETEKSEHKEHRVLEELVLGKNAPIAAKVLMKILYAARMARLDLLRAVNHLACFITKCDQGCDLRLRRLVSYIYSTLHLRQCGWIYCDEKPSDLELHLYADADFGGCPTQKSTSGAFMCIRGKNSFFPINGASKRQGSVSHSTPEAEIVAADFALRTMGLPAILLWERLLSKKVILHFHEDNQAMIKVMEK